LFKNGKPHGLCDVYGAFLQDELVNAVIVLKDRDSYYHFSSALVVKDYKYNESPPAKLHFFIMQDCFYNENKKVYNISFGGSNNLMRFKELFNPVEIERPPYYTYEINKKALSFSKILSPQVTTFIRNTFKAASKTLTKPAQTAMIIFELWLCLN